MNFSDALAIALEAHKDQFDKSGEPYLYHPIRVALRVNPYGEDTAAVALLHDVLEDTDYPLTEKLLKENQWNALIALTRIPFPDETYGEYIDRVEVNPMAKRVKIADIYDNLSDERMKNLDPGEQEGMKKRYSKALDQLGIKQ